MRAKNRRLCITLVTGLGAVGLLATAVCSTEWDPTCVRNVIETRLQSLRRPVPRMHLRETTFDWGVCREGEQVKHTFEVHNDGVADLVLDPYGPVG